MDYQNTHRSSIVSWEFLLCIARISLLIGSLFLEAELKQCRFQRKEQKKFIPSNYIELHNVHFVYHRWYVLGNFRVFTKVILIYQYI